VVDVFIGVSQARRDALDKANQAIPTLQQARALVDTGATLTAIDRSVISKLNLSPTGTASIHTPSTGQNPHLADLYDVGIFFVHPPRLTFPVYTVPVLEADLLLQGGIQALIGRDILQLGLMIYDGVAGMFSLGF
jgi:hypothetical protein